MHYILMLIVIALNGPFLTIQTDAPRHLYVELTPEGGAVLASPTIFEFDLTPDATFGTQINAHGPGRIRVRVWRSDGGTEPTDEQVIELPTHRYYLPL